MTYLYLYYSESDEFSSKPVNVSPLLNCFLIAWYTHEGSGILNFPNFPYTRRLNCLYATERKNLNRIKIKTSILILAQCTSDINKFEGKKFKRLIRVTPCLSCLSYIMNVVLFS